MFFKSQKIVFNNFFLFSRRRVPTLNVEDPNGNHMRSLPANGGQPRLSCSNSRESGGMICPPPVATKRLEPRREPGIDAAPPATTITNPISYTTIGASANGSNPANNGSLINNNLTANGMTTNGASVNGSSTNGASVNGSSINGACTNGADPNTSNTTVDSPAQGNNPATLQITENSHQELLQQSIGKPKENLPPHGAVNV